MLYMDHGGANNKIFDPGFRYEVQTICPATSYHQGTLDMIKAIDRMRAKLSWPTRTRSSPLAELNKLPISAFSHPPSTIDTAARPDAGLIA